jgi:hypothetical protein
MVSTDTFLGDALRIKETMDKDGMLGNCDLTKYMPNTARPVFGQPPTLRDAADFHNRIRTVENDGQQLSLIASFMTNSKNLTSYTLYSVTADILPELEKDRHAMFRTVFKENA